ncbi:serine/threonine protein kinase [Micromonospora echinospora]|uniref:serine/threonine-protein kinase n=1 Tax=Micromonospora echinospora TaxID=1877 RepID=UPI000B5AF6F9|nr:serine/threonine-protein kinase [Micromonospora echinospora]OZV78885.1 serine/threonine protein kinase [Micromonospora echinospora]
MTSPERIGSYRIERLLGAGSFATVWLGHDPVLCSSVAIKVLAENWHHDLRVRERFLDEARLLRRLDDERLVRVHAVGELADGRPYSVMVLADGGSLRDRLAAGPLPVPVALDLLAEIAAGVAVLHRHGVVHRDLTPGNILFRSHPDGERVLVADLGLAKALAAASGLTARAGTPGYMAPEQDDPLAVVDTRADVYGLGRLGVRLLGADARRNPPAPPAPPGPDGTVRLRAEVPPQVADVLRRATALRPADRHRDAEAFRAALRHAAASARRPAPGSEAGRPASGSGAGRPGPASGDGPAASTPTSGSSGPPARTGRPWTRQARTVSGSSPPPTSGAGPAGRRFAATVVGGAVLVAVGTLAGDTATVRDAHIGTSGPITVVLPPGWRAVGTGWAGQYGADGSLEPALVISPDPRRWAADPTVPGAFVGLSASTAARTTPAGFVAERPHASCAAAPVRRTRRAGVDWVVARFTCERGRPVVVEAAGLGPDRTGLIYVQVVPPAGSDAAFVDRLLAGVRVR